MTLYTKDPNISEYGPIPYPLFGLFQKDYGYEKPVKVHGWEWSSTFQCWRALVTFADGWHGITSPKPAKGATVKVYNLTLGGKRVFEGNAVIHGVLSVEPDGIIARVQFIDQDDSGIYSRYILNSEQ